MALHRLEDYYPNYRDPFGGSTIKTIDVYDRNNEAVGTVRNFLVDGETGRLRYLTMETGLWAVGRIVLLPVGLAQLAHENQSIRISQLTKKQIENLPDLAGELGTAASYEERISRVYGSAIATSSFNSSSSKDAEVHSQDSDIYAATGSLHDYENDLIFQQNSKSNLRY